MSKMEAKQDGRRGKRRRFTDELKAGAVRLVLEDELASGLIEALVEISELPKFVSRPSSVAGVDRRRGAGTIGLTCRRRRDSAPVQRVAATRRLPQREGISYSAA